MCDDHVDTVLFKAICTRQDDQKFGNHFLTSLVEVAVAWQFRKASNYLTCAGYANGLTVAATLATFLVHALAGTKRPNQGQVHLGALWNFAGVKEKIINLTCVVVVASLHCCDHILCRRAWRALVRFADTACRFSRDGGAMEQASASAMERLMDAGQV